VGSEDGARCRPSVLPTRVARRERERYGAQVGFRSDLLTLEFLWNSNLVTRYIHISDDSTRNSGAWPLVEPAVSTGYKAAPEFFSQHVSLTKNGGRAVGVGIGGWLDRLRGMFVAWLRGAPIVVISIFYPLNLGLYPLLPSSYYCSPSPKASLETENVSSAARIPHPPLQPYSRSHKIGAHDK